MSGTIFALTSAVQTSLGKADTAIQDVSGKEDTSNKATNLTSPDNTKYPTTKAVSDALANIDALPDQSGQNGKFLGTDGTDASRQVVNTNDTTEDMVTSTTT